MSDRRYSTARWQRLRKAVLGQQQEIAEMAERLARYEHPKRPAIY